MANLTKIDFLALDITEKNYLSWILDAEIHLESMGLEETIKENNNAISQDKAKALIFLRHHLDEGLKNEYLTVKDPEDLWQNLKERYDHLKTVILPKTRYEWLHLRLQDFKYVAEYNSKIFEINSKLKLCGEKITDEEILEKTFSTFHVSNVLLQQQYRERRFKKYFELISCLLVDEQNNKFLMKNHESRPTGSTSFPEVNAIAPTNHGRGQSRGHYQGRGRGRNNVWHHVRYDWHWSRTCHTVKHLVDLYQASEKGKDKNVEVNFTDQENHSQVEPSSSTHLDTTDFFEQLDVKMLLIDELKRFIDDERRKIF